MLRHAIRGQSEGPVERSAGPFAMPAAMCSRAMQWITALALAPSLAAAAPGAMVPFVEIEAENAAFTGTVDGPSRRFGDLAAEASGRRAVVLRKRGDHVEFTLERPA